LKKFSALILLVLFQSCHYFENQVPSEKELLERQLNEINWNEVDEYPSVGDCDSLSDKEARKQCFFEYLNAKIQEKIGLDTLSNLFPKLDTIQVKVTVNSNKTLTFEPQFTQDSVAYDKEKIDSILKARLVNLPEINPAIKRGIPVKTQFSLPVIIKTND